MAGRKVLNLITFLVSVDASWDGPVITVEREEKIPQNQPIAGRKSMRAFPKKILAQEDEIAHNRIVPSYRTDGIEV